MDGGGEGGGIEEGLAEDLLVVTEQELRDRMIAFSLQLLSVKINGLVAFLVKIGMDVTILQDSVLAQCRLITDPDMRDLIVQAITGQFEGLKEQKRQLAHPNEVAH